MVFYLLSSLRIYRLTYFLDTTKSLANSTKAYAKLASIESACQLELTRFRSSQKYGCEVDKLACSQTQNALGACTAALTAKSDSYNNLKEDCDELSEEWENVTSSLATCLQGEEQLDKDLAAHRLALSECQQSIEDFKRDSGESLAASESRSATLGAVVDSIQEDLKCLGGTPNCSCEAGKYLCLPRIMTSTLCLKVSVSGQELFGLEQCQLLGDPTVWYLSPRPFARENPYVVTLLIFTTLFATIGFVCSFIICLWCVIICRKKRRTTKFRVAAPVPGPVNAGGVKGLAFPITMLWVIYSSYSFVLYLTIIVF